jgi:hypothetical protein
MNARRDDLIRLAAETLDCVGNTAHGHWIYRDPSTCLWVVSDNSMARLGKLTETHHADAYGIWCRNEPAVEVDVGAFVRDFGLTSASDLDLVELGAAYGPFRLLLRFYRQDVVDTIRINEEIDRDRDDDCDDEPSDETLAMHGRHMGER